ncbi:Protein of unknown function [Pyronema omphalodes CBS 100304]|uniref:Uncharacterized protein n=1 Tax=Pyronema omphalodes (strain CBS 100304) TaxID=1076935 RepID=U4LNS5_PYROM|nr:Protein of unknown function [Pyronema omphalodes CBS 100304]
MSRRGLIVALTSYVLYAIITDFRSRSLPHGALAICRSRKHNKRNGIVAPSASTHSAMFGLHLEATEYVYHRTVGLATCTMELLPITCAHGWILEL